MTSSPKRRPGLLRRITRGTVDTAAMGGIARMGVGDVGRTGHNLQTRFVADSALATYREADDQDERTRALWSVGGALALAVLGGLTAANSIATGNVLAMALGLAQLLTAASVVVTVARHGTKGTIVHLLGVALAVVSVYESVVAYPPFTGETFALAGLLLAIGAIVGLVVGRR